MLRSYVGYVAENIDIVKQGMRRVVTNSPKLKYDIGQVIDCAAKTGTSEVEHNVKGEQVVLTNGFFITFAPYDEPEIAICVAIEGAESGSTCAPVAQAIYEYYFKNSKDKETEDAQNQKQKQKTGTLILLLI